MNKLFEQIITGIQGLFLLRLLGRQTVELSIFPCKVLGLALLLRILGNPALQPAQPVCSQRKPFDRQVQVCGRKPAVIMQEHADQQCQGIWQDTDIMFTYSKRDNDSQFTLEYISSTWSIFCLFLVCTIGKYIYTSLYSDMILLVMII